MFFSKCTLNANLAFYRRMIFEHTQVTYSHTHTLTHIRWRKMLLKVKKVFFFCGLRIALRLPFLWNFLGKISSAVDFDCERICQIAVCNGAAKNQRDFQYQYIHAAVDRIPTCPSVCVWLSLWFAQWNRPATHPTNHPSTHLFRPLPMRLNNSLTAVCLPFVIGEAFAFAPPLFSATAAAFSAFGGRKIGRWALGGWKMLLDLWKLCNIFLVPPDA